MVLGGWGGGGAAIPAFRCFGPGSRTLKIFLPEWGLEGFKAFDEVLQMRIPPYYSKLGVQCYSLFNNQKT